MTEHRFDGSTFSQRRDGRRLTKQFERVRDLMLDGEWRSLRAIGDELNIPEASASARLRDLRKPRFGGFLVDRKYTDNGLHVYRLRVPRARVIEPVPEPTPEPQVEEVRLFDPAIAHRPLSAYDRDAA